LIDIVPRTLRAISNERRFADSAARIFRLAGGEPNRATLSASFVA
jgi:hypothetical protein